MKYQVVGSPGQVAAIDFHCSLNLARKICSPARFSNGCSALVAGGTLWSTKRDAELFRQRCNSALAYLSGRLGRWLTPTFVIQPAPSTPGIQSNET